MPGVDCPECGWGLQTRQHVQSCEQTERMPATEVELPDMEVRVPGSRRGPPRKYATNAERQKAYRGRK